MAPAIEDLGSCDFCGHRLWAVSGEVVWADGQYWITLECSQKPDPDQCTSREFTVSEIFGE
jgi:hypothetical protein